MSADPLPLLQGAGPGGVTGVEEGLGVHVRTGGQLTDRDGRDVNTAAVRQAVLVHGISVGNRIGILILSYTEITRKEADYLKVFLSIKLLHKNLIEKRK